MYGIKKKIFRYYMNLLEIYGNREAITEEGKRLQDFRGINEFANTEEGKRLFRVLKTIWSKRPNDVHNHITLWVEQNNSNVDVATKERIIDRYNDFFYNYYLDHSSFKTPRTIKKEEPQRANKCRYCNRQKNGRFDTCCQACINGSHTEECDRRNRVLPTYTQRATKDVSRGSTGLTLERWKEEKGGKKKRRTNKKRTKKNKSRKFRK